MDVVAGPRPAHSCLILALLFVVAPFFVASGVPPFLLVGPIPDLDLALGDLVPSANPLLV